MVSPVRIYAMAYKELIHILRDIRSLAIIILIPVILLLIFGYAVTFDIKHLNLAILDLDGSTESRHLVRAFSVGKYFDAPIIVKNRKEIIFLLDREKIRAGLIIPEDFTKDLMNNRAEVQLLLDGADANSANVIKSYAVFVTRNEGVYLTGKNISLPVDMEIRVWFNENMESKNFIVPGLVAVIMTIIGALLTSLSVVREVEGGSMEFLMSTQVTGLEIMVGKMMPYFVVGMSDLLLAVVMAKFIFEIELAGSFIVLVFVSALFLIVSMGIGFFISVVAGSQLIANQIAIIVTFLPAFLLSGFIFSIENMPEFLQAITRLLPARYYVSALKDIYLKGLSMSYLYEDIIFLSAVGLFFMGLALLAFRRKIG